MRANAYFAKIDLPSLSLQPGEASATPFQIEDATADMMDEDFREAWRMQLAKSGSPERIYQSFEYFQFLKETSPQESVHVFAVRDTQTNKYVGFVPVRVIDQPLEFSVNGKVFAKPAVRTISLLGSVALLPEKQRALEQLSAYLFDKFRDCVAISMKAMPRKSATQMDLDRPESLWKRRFFYVLHGWRDCHTIPLPGTFKEYQEQMSAKKRYNLNRQIKQLEKQAGSVKLHRIDTPEQIPLLLDALAAVTPPDQSRQFLSEAKYRSLAAHGLLHCYVLEAGGRHMGLIMATRYDNVLHLHNVIHVPELEMYSIGTSILHLAIKDLTDNFSFSHIDLGYGVPAHRHKSTNVTEERGHVILFRKSLHNLLLVQMHDAFTRLVELTKRMAARYRDFRSIAAK